MRWEIPLPGTQKNCWWMRRHDGRGSRITGAVDHESEAADMRILFLVTVQGTLIPIHADPPCSISSSMILRNL